MPHLLHEGVQPGDGGADFSDLAPPSVGPLRLLEVTHADGLESAGAGGRRGQMVEVLAAHAAVLVTAVTAVVGQDGVEPPLDRVPRFVEPRRHGDRRLNQVRSSGIPPLKGGGGGEQEATELRWCIMSNG